MVFPIGKGEAIKGRRPVLGESSQVALGALDAFVVRCGVLPVPEVAEVRRRGGAGVGGVSHCPRGLVVDCAGEGGEDVEEEEEEDGAEEGEGLKGRHIERLVDVIRPDSMRDDERLECVKVGLALM